VSGNARHLFYYPLFTAKAVRRVLRAGEGGAGQAPPRNPFARRSPNTAAARLYGFFYSRRYAKNFRVPFLSRPAQPVMVCFMSTLNVAPNFATPRKPRLLGAGFAHAPRTRLAAFVRGVVNVQNFFGVGLRQP